MKKIIGIALILQSSIVSMCLGQDTIRMMHYNLLNYGNFTTYCTASNNSLVNKDAYLKTIAGYVKPDVFTVNEMGADPIYADRILANSLNVNGVTHYQRAAFTNNSFSDLVNMLFYNKNVFALHSQKQITKDLNNNDLARVIDIYRMYYKDAALSTTHDTIFVNFIVAHLKAGSAAADAQQRDLETAALMSHLSNPVKRENFIMSGDFNVYGATENAFQNLVSPAVPELKFYDPVNMLGEWSNDGAYASIHTQSTHTTSGCASSGGLDDRFDFILMNDYVMGDSADVKYVTGTYKAIGQDGGHFNQAVNSGTNTSAPSGVISAVYGMSDHLPVMADLRINASPSGIRNNTVQYDLFIVNPVTDILEVRFKKDLGTAPDVEIYSLTGQLVYKKTMQALGSGYSLKDNSIELSRGTYILSVVDASGFRSNKKIVKY